MTLRSLPATTFALLAAISPLTAETDLESNFANPPVINRPYVWWHWMGSNFSKEGITKDLEAMKASGIGGATIFNIASAVQESHKPTLNNPWPDQTYRSPKYWEALRHAAAEAQRLGLEIGLHNTVGYSTTGGPWIDEEKNMQQLVTKSVTIDGGKKVSVELPRPDPTSYRGWGSSGQRFSFFRDVAVLAAPAEGVVDPQKVIDLTKSFRDGKLEWNAPPGKWQIIRFAHAPTGSNPHPLPDELIGKTLEVDKLSLEHNRYHWDQVIEPMKKHLGPYLGKSVKHFLIDSYEAGSQNWTSAFREEFEKRKGYDPLPWLISTQQRVVGNPELTARFQWDYQDVIRTLFYENGWLTGRAKMKAVGMDLQFEPYGGQFDTTEGAALADLPMGEFWTGGGGGISGAVVAAARAAGRRVVGAEAFTGPPTLSNWSETPGFLKRSTDGTFASGANRMILHHWVHQPFDDRFKPGMGMGWWGTHFNRHQTWAKDGAAFFQYLGRAQALLQAGESPSEFASVNQGQGGDIISWREFRKGLSVKNGRIVLSSGRSYPFLSIPHNGRMLATEVRRLEDLLQAGAIIVCSKPDGTPGLQGYPKSNDLVRSSTLWNGPAVHRVGKGKLYTKGDLNAARRDFAISPIFQFAGASGITGCARVTAKETLFFVANTAGKTNRFTASFRVTGLRPELWDAETGNMRFAPVWCEKNGRTEVDLTLDSHRSIFVVFRAKSQASDHVVSCQIQAPTDDSLTITRARFGAASANRWMDVREKLQELAAAGSLQLPHVHTSVFEQDPAPNVVKTLEIEYRYKGKDQRIAVSEGEPLNIGSPVALTAPQVRAAADGSLSILSRSAARVELVYASGKRQTQEIPAPTAPVELKGPWQVTLDSPVEASRRITLPALMDLSKHEDPSVKYFSGTATYTTEFSIPDANAPLQLNLGQVKDLARVTLNGKDLGVLWQAPYQVDLTAALKPGKNQLSIAVTNTWHNRLVGDEQHPADFEWGEDRGDKGHAMKAYPDWFVKNQPRPEKNRKCFVIWYYHRKDTSLLPAGLIGPVSLTPQSRCIIKP